MIKTILLYGLIGCEGINRARLWRLTGEFAIYQMVLNNGPSTGLKPIKGLQLSCRRNSLTRPSINSWSDNESMFLGKTS